MSCLSILQVLPHLNSGGVERGTIDIARYLSKNGYSSFVCSSGGIKVQEVIDSGSTHIKLPVHSKNLFVMLLDIVRLIRLIKTYKIDVVHARSRAPAWSCYIACKITSTPFVTTFHGTYSTRGFLKKLYNSVMLKSSKTIAVSNFIYSHIIANYEVDAKKITVINRGVDLKYFGNIRPDRVERVLQRINIDQSSLTGKKIILMPARFVRWKGHLYLLDTLKHIKSDYLCIMVGTVSAKHIKYFNQIKDTVDDRVILSHDVKDIAALYQISDVVISASQIPEAFGRTITEAQAMQKIVLATKGGGASDDAIINGVTGFHIPVHNAHVAAQVLDRVLNMNDKRYNRITKAAFETVKSDFSLSQMCDKTVAVYNALAISRS